MKQNNTTSVVMATYNGACYVKEQLQSIINQNRKPDEIIIMDDCSTDDTVGIIKELLGSSQINYYIYVNKKNIGWRANFIKGFHYATGDFIFCADQDDLWYPEKIEIMTNILKDNERINVLACNLAPLYERGSRKIADFYINNYGEDYIARVDLRDTGFTMVRTGCTLCFRRCLLNLIDLVWTEQLAHDEVIWAVGLVTEGLYIVNKPLIQFRRHGNNNSPSNEKSLKRRLFLAECNHVKIANLIKNNNILGISDTNLYLLKRLNEFSNDRIKAFKEKKVLQGLKLLKYRTYYRSIKPWLIDVFVILKGKFC